MKKLCSLLLVCTFAPMLFGATSQVASQLAQEVERQNYKHNQIVAQQQAHYEKDIAPIQAFLNKVFMLK